MEGILTCALLAVGGVVVANLVVRFSIAMNDHHQAAIRLNKTVPLKTFVVDGISIFYSLVLDMCNNIYIKVLLLLYSAAFMLLSRESRGISQAVESQRKVDPKEAEVVQRKNIIFIRHGESVWNYGVNRGIDAGSVLRLAFIASSEALLACEKDSVIWDSPLSSAGLSQACVLQKWISHGEYECEKCPPLVGGGETPMEMVVMGGNENDGNGASAETGKYFSSAGCDAGEAGLPVQGLFAEDRSTRNLTDSKGEASVELQTIDTPGGEAASLKILLSILNGEDAKVSSVLVTSNLRRAISTLLVVLSDRIRRTKERVYVLSCLQEATRNPDGLSLAGGHQLQCLSQLEKSLATPSLSTLYSSSLDTTFNFGNKSLYSQLTSRIAEFSEWIFEKCPADTAVVCGHSLWFKSFFKLYLMPGVEHVAKSRKIVNCGIVKFEFLKLKTRGIVGYRIDPNSLLVIHGGFEK